jgi:hypothetical protein
LSLFWYLSTNKTIEGTFSPQFKPNMSHVKGRILMSSAACT